MRKLIKKIKNILSIRLGLGTFMLFVLIIFIYGYWFWMGFPVNR